MSLYELVKYDMWAEGDGIWTVNDLIPTSVKLEMYGLTERGLLEFLRENFDLEYLAGRYRPHNCDDCDRDDTCNNYDDCDDRDDCDKRVPDRGITIEADDFEVRERDELLYGVDDDGIDGPIYISINGTPLCELRRIRN